MKPVSAHPSPGFGGTATVPGDKSISHRALILGGLADGTTRIKGLLTSEDVMATAAAVEAFGATIERGEDYWSVTGAEWQSPGTEIDCGNSGTSARLLMGAAAGFDGLRATFKGDASLSKRPMERVIRPLTRMGAKFEGGDTLPVTLHGAQLGGIDHESAVASAQVKTAILLAGLRTKSPVQVIEPHPSRDHSEVMLAMFGVEGDAEQLEAGWAVSLGKQRQLTATDIVVPADPSSAAFLWAAAAIIDGASVTTPGVCINATRTGFIEALERMGAGITLDNERIQSGEPVADITVTQAPLQPIHVTPEQVPATIDELPLLACVAAFAEGESHFEGIGELRVKESDRLGAVAAGLAANGVSCFPEKDALRVLGKGEVRGGGTVMVHHDHRIAMAFLTLGLGAQNPVRIDDMSPIATSFPDYISLMQSLGARLEQGV
ncbi:3-phosphoshikimate 1-carboxyvinyltransferase [Sphingomicrobium marinum]|uniref:3-phosphoshikimate 1-carboxyvinyltransferase n=1 Tax=Sphingomicrobium marinum TaxID=1227950 RepID=UPI00223F4E22|nr:3-phosphoshikimate 1-carboxyvinyltransferase [Sphingomicrobium marinum]